MARILTRCGGVQKTTSLVLGGLAAVIYTDALQCLLMIFGAGALAIYGELSVTD